ncbi:MULTISPECIES: cell wall-binding repeat-containing protein [unclassified Ornithinimicrobium]|uniref:cell wall-binding repeat-containing protein n=1 Tax=unclassified Ornithinimicrobium TaxID=2615080 RepID=UPI003852D50C
MRRPLIALLSALAVALTSTLAVADPQEGTSTSGPVVDLQAPVHDVDQRFGWVEHDSDLITGPTAVVEAEVDGLPAPQPGAEVFPRPADGVYDVTGGGFGHGIGMSQYGADGAGKAGLSHAEILAFYYPGTTLEARSTGPVRIGLTIDNDGVTQVVHRPGLVASSTPGGSTYALPPGYTQWRVLATGSTQGSCRMEGHTAQGSWQTVWPAAMPQACPVTFSSPSEGTVDLVLPGGTARVYRGALTATHRGSTSLSTVNHLPMQHYLRSVVMAEMPTSFHTEALRSQAVAARTYALRGSNGTSYYDTCDTTACQAYRGAGARRADGTITAYEHASTTSAVGATDGQVLTYPFGTGRALATTMYSSSTGGHTARGDAGHGYLRAQPDPYDAVAINPRHSWTAHLPVSSLEQRYGIHRLERVQILRRDGDGSWGGRVLEARVEGYTAAGAYTWAYATGDGLSLARSWPTFVTGLSSNYFTIHQEVEPTPPAQPLSRIAGGDRYATAAEAARSWSPGVGVVYVVSGQDFPDALTAAARAGVYDAPVLLTRPDEVPRVTVEAMERLRPQRVVVVGGPMAVSTPAADRLARLTTTGALQRVADTSRYGTAAAMASFYPAGGDRVYLASGETFPDALAGAALAADQQAPLLLTRHGQMDAATVRQLERLGAREVVVLGGTDAVAETVAQEAARYTRTGTVRRLAGDDRYATMERVAAEFPAGRSPAYIASAQGFPDALVGAALAGSRGVPVILTSNTSVRSATAAALKRQAPGQIFVLGGPTTITDTTMERLRPFLR